MQDCTTSLIQGQLHGMLLFTTCTAGIAAHLEHENPEAGVAVQAEKLGVQAGEALIQDACHVLPSDEAIPCASLAQQAEEELQQLVQVLGIMRLLREALPHPAPTSPIEPSLVFIRQIGLIIIHLEAASSV